MEVQVHIVSQPEVQELKGEEVFSGRKNKKQKRQLTTRRAGAVMRIRKGRRRSKKDGGKGRQPKEQEGVQKDGEGRLHRMKL